MQFDVFCDNAFVGKIEQDSAPSAGEVLTIDGARFEVNDVTHFGAGRSEIYTAKGPAGKAAVLAKPEPVATPAADDKPAEAEAAPAPHALRAPRRRSATQEAPKE